MKPWRIQCWCGKSLISKIIRFRTWSDFSHVSITDGTWLWEATTPKVRKVCPQVVYREMKGIPVAELGFKDALNDGHEIMLESFLDNHVGDKYSVGELLRFMVRDDENSENDNWICSEFVATACQRIGRDLQQRILMHKVDPGMVFMSPTLFLLRFGVFILNGAGEYQFEDMNIEQVLKQTIYAKQ